MERKSIQSFKLVFSNWRYSLLAIIVAIAFYEINVTIADYKTLASFSESFGIIGFIEFFISLSLGFGETIHTHSYISLVLSSILLGTLVSLIAFKVRMSGDNLNKKSGFFATSGLFLAALAPGCAACGVGLIAIFGLSGALIQILPFDGLEISILAVAVLAFANWKVSKDLLTCKNSKLLFKKMKGGK